MRIKILLTVALFLSIFMNSEMNAQVSDLSYEGWYNMRSDISKMQHPVKVGANYFSTVELRDRNDLFPRKYVIEINEKGQILQDLFYKKNEEGDRIDFFYVTNINNQLFGYYEIERGDNSILYRSEIDTKNYQLSKKKEQILSGEKSRNLPSPILGDLNPSGDIEHNYFGKRLYSFINFPLKKKELILKREPGKLGDTPLIKFVLLNEKKEIIEEGRIKLFDTNKRTSIEDVEIDNQNNIYLLTSTRDGNDREYTISVYDQLEKDDRNIKLKDDRFIQELQLSVMDNQLMLAGLASEKRGNFKNWDVIVAPVDLSARTVSKFITLESGAWDQEDVIDINHAGNTFFVHVIEHRAANISSTNSRGISRTNSFNSRSFTPRETDKTKIIAVSPSGEKKWDFLIPNNIRAEIYTYNEREEGYKTILYDNYLFLERENKMVVIFAMNPLNETKPKKNGRSRSVVLRNKKRFGMKAISFDDNGVSSERIIYEGKHDITPIPHFTFEADNDIYFMLGQRYRGGTVSVGRVVIK